MTTLSNSSSTRSPTGDGALQPVQHTHPLRAVHDQGKLPLNFTGAVLRGDTASHPVHVPGPFFEDRVTLFIFLTGAGKDVRMHMIFSDMAENDPFQP